MFLQYLKVAEYQWKLLKHQQTAFTAVAKWSNSTKETKTIKRGKLEPKHNCVSKFPGKVNWCFSNCSLKPMVRCVPYGTLHAIIREMHWKMPGEIVLGFNPPQTHYKLQLSLAKCLLHCLLVIKLILEYQISYSPCYSWF